MVNANELRIGNLIEKGGEWFAADFIAIQMAHNYNPIPLTPEILEKYGFEKSNEFRTYRLNEFDIEYVFGEWHWVVDDRGDNEGTKPRTIKYLHQLQNLYFLLTGKELSYEQPY